MTEFRIEEVPGEVSGHDNFQWGWRIVYADTGLPFLDLSTGGTGACWNVREPDDDPDADVGAMHICDLDEFLLALTTLRNSRAYQANEERWK